MRYGLRYEGALLAFVFFEGAVALICHQDAAILFLHLIL